MRMIRRTLVVVLVATAPCSAGPTREEVTAFAKECVAKKVRIDLIARFGADYRGVDLRGVDLRGFSVNHPTNLRGADFSGSNLSQAILTGSILDGADFTGANLTAASLGSCSLNKARLDGANLVGANLDFARLEGASLTKADLSGTELSAARFDGADLRGAILRGAKCQWYSPHFQGADLSDADLEGVDLLRDADFRGATLRRARLRNADLRGADFTGADLSETNPEAADIRHAVFRDVTGIPGEDLAQLRRRAARWEYEWQSFGTNLLHVGLPVAFFAAVITAVVLGGRTRPLTRSQLGWRLAGALLLAGFFLVASRLMGESVYGEPRILAGPAWLFRTQSPADHFLGVVGTGVLLPCIFAVGLRRSAITIVLSILGLLAWVGFGVMIEVVASC
jgi:uncharacterized protein YjbI with pentapeptide repeats